MTRLIQYCEAIEQLSQKVRRYEQILENDLNKIQQTGEKIVEKTNNLKTIKNDRFKLSCKIGRRNVDKNIELQEVKELQSRFQASATELNQQFESLLGKIADFSEINSFQEPLMELKAIYLEFMEVLFQVVWSQRESLSMQFEKQ